MDKDEKAMRTLFQGLPQRAPGRGFDSALLAKLARARAPMPRWQRWSLDLAVTAVAGWSALLLSMLDWRAILNGPSAARLAVAKAALALTQAVELARVAGGALSRVPAPELGGLAWQLAASTVLAVAVLSLISRPAQAAAAVSRRK